MSTLLASLLVMLNMPTSNFELPKTWTKDFVITLSFTGSMDGSSTHVTFTYDSCSYKWNSGMKASKTGTYALTEANRVEILKKLRELKVNKIKSEMNIAAVSDGWSSLMCFGHHCIEGGTSAKMSDKDKDLFNAAFGYLEGFAASE